MAKSDRTTVRLTLTDRVIARFSPNTALRRFAAKVSLANLARAYDGASKGRGTDGWATSSKSADAEVGPAGALLRDRMRDLVRNNATAAQALSVLVTAMVGPGIRPRAKTPNAALNKKIDAIFEAWSREADADGHTDFYGLQALICREALEGGDGLALMRPRRKSDALPIPLQVQILEGDHIDSARNQDLGGGAKIRLGIEYDGIGRRTAYWLWPIHPGDQNPVLGRSLMSERVPASRVCHLFERQRTQSRGTPWGTPALRALRDIDDWALAEMVRKKTEAAMVAIVFGADEDQQSIAATVEDSEGNKVEQFEPGLIAYARGGKDVKFNQPSSAGGVYEWTSVMEHRVAAGFRVPYELLTGDLRQVNFSSARVGMQQFFRTIEQFQWHALIPMFCQPVWESVMLAAWTAGLIESPDVPVEWMPPSFQSVNPFQDAQTDLLEVRAGFVSPQQAIAKRGYDPAQTIADITNWNTLIDAAKLILDSDPRRVTKGGQGQGPVAYDPDTGEPITTTDTSGAAPAPGKGETIQ